MVKKQYVSYSKCFKPKEESKLLPEYLVFLLKNKRHQKAYELQAMLHKVIHHEKPPPTASFDF